MKKFFKYLGIFLLVGAVVWVGLFFTVPQVKDLTYRVFNIERTFEDDTTNTEDENTDNENTGDETTEDETAGEETEDDKMQVAGPGGTLEEDTTTEE